MAKKNSPVVAPVQEEVVETPVAEVAAENGSQDNGTPLGSEGNPTPYYYHRLSSPMLLKKVANPEPGDNLIAIAQTLQKRGRIVPEATLESWKEANPEKAAEHFFLQVGEAKPAAAAKATKTPKEGGRAKRTPEEIAADKEAKAKAREEKRLARQANSTSERKLIKFDGTNNPNIDPIFTTPDNTFHVAGREPDPEYPNGYKVRHIIFWVGNEQNYYPVLEGFKNPMGVTFRKLTLHGAEEATK